MFPSTAVRRLAAAGLIFPGAGVPGPGWVNPLPVPHHLPLR